MDRFVRVDKPAAFRNAAGPRPRRALTAVWPADKTPTYVAPVSDPLGRTRPQGWDVYSRDGLWHYKRYETGARTQWLVVYRPTGQIRDGYGGRRDALAATAAGLVEALQMEAFAHALRSPLDDERRPAAHRQLAIHLRTSGTVKGAEADHRCQCGGFLAVITRDGDLAHVDACDRCYSYGAGLPAEACPHPHSFCGDPLVAGYQNGCGLWREGCCPGNCRTPAVAS